MINSVYLLLLCFAGQSAQSPPEPQGASAGWQMQRVDLTAKNQSLSLVVAALSSRLKCAILVDGKPGLKEADFDLHSSGREALDTVSETFDYSWKVGKSGVVLLNKRFTVDKEVPQTHLAEMTQMTGDIARLLPKTGVEPNQMILPLNALYRTLTLEQLNLLSNKQPINFMQLPAEQQKLVHLAIVNNTLSDAQSRWERLHILLTALPRARLIRRPCVWQAIVKRPSSTTAPPQEKPRYVVKDQNGHVVEDMMVRSVQGEELVCLWQDEQGREQSLQLFLAEVPTQAETTQSVPTKKRQ